MSERHARARILALLAVAAPAHDALALQDAGAFAVVLEVVWSFIAGVGLVLAVRAKLRDKRP